jgi:transcription initiation factor TFIID TATA-box-binding protein
MSAATAIEWRAMSDTTPVADTLTVQNVVASTTIDRQLALQAIADDLAAATYTAETGPALTYRSTTLNTTVQCFRSGTLITLGAPNRTVARESLNEVLTHLNDLGIPVPDTPDITIQNMVFTADLGTTLTLDAVAIGLGLDRTEYEPEQFPGLIYRPPDIAVVILVFATGKLVITGTMEPAPAATALTALADQLVDIGLRED